MSDVAQYGIAAAVTFLLLREIFAFIVKMRTKSNGQPQCSFALHEQNVTSHLMEIRDGIRELVILARNRE